VRPENSIQRFQNHGVGRGSLVHDHGVLFVPTYGTVAEDLTVVLGYRHRWAMNLDETKVQVIIVPC